MLSTSILCTWNTISKDKLPIIEYFRATLVIIDLLHTKLFFPYCVQHWQIPLGRRFRSLKLWFVMRSFGAEGLRAHIRRQVALANEFHQLVSADPRFQLPVPAAMGLVCFRLKVRTKIKAKLFTCSYLWNFVIFFFKGRERSEWNAAKETQREWTDPSRTVKTSRSVCLASCHLFEIHGVTWCNLRLAGD